MPSPIFKIRRSLAAVADPARAPRMQAYMKSSMPYHGVPTPVLKKLCRTLLPEIPLPNAEAFHRTIRQIWHEARFREERYIAIELTADRRAAPFQPPDALPLYEELIVSGAWWDYVDTLAIHRVGPLLLAHPALKKKLLSWSRSDDLWKRRTSIICQVAARSRIDLPLLYACIEPSLASREFFLRKAIGWALRQHAWQDPAEIQRYIAECGERLSPLSRREALINAEGRRARKPSPP